MTRQQLTDRIMQLNRSARAEFLAQFNEAELQAYLDRLDEISDAFQAQFHAEPDVPEFELIVAPDADLVLTA